MAAANKGDKDMVKFLFKYSPDVKIVDKCGKSVIDRASSPEIASLIQDLSLFSSKATKTTNKEKLIQKSKVKEELKSHTERNGFEKTNSLIQSFLMKAKGRLSREIADLLEKDLVEQYRLSDVELQRILSKNFQKEENQFLKCTLMQFNQKIEKILEKQGIKNKNGIILTKEEITELINSYNSRWKNVNTPRPFKSYVNIKPREKTPAAKQSKPEKELGFNVMSYLGTQFHDIRNEVLTKLSKNITKNSAEIFKILKNTSVASNYRSFENLTKEVEAKIGKLVNEKVTRIEKRMKTKLSKSASKPTLSTPGVDEYLRTESSRQLNETIRKKLFLSEAKTEMGIKSDTQEKEELVSCVNTQKPVLTKLDIQKIKQRKQLDMKFVRSHDIKIKPIIKRESMPCKLSLDKISLQRSQSTNRKSGSFVYSTMDNTNKKTNTDDMSVFHKAIENNEKMK